MSAGRYVALEGGEGSGKSTQAAMLVEHLGAVATREPGATDLGRCLRELLLDPTTGVMEHRAEALLMAADRAQHLSEVVLPALASGRDVVSDRSAYSTLAYQGWGRGLDVDELRRLCDWACFGRWPDVVVLVDVPVEVGLGRVGAGRDRLEQVGEGFHQRVRDGFRALAAADPKRWAVVDGTEPLERVTHAVQAAIAERLGSAG